MTDAAGSGSSSADGGRRRHGLDRRWLHPGDDRGAILVISALVLVALVGIAAIVVDLGMARETRREAQSDADLSALAAGWFLAGNGSASYASNPRAACEAALTSVATNIGDWPAGASLPCTSFPTTAASCTAASAATTVSATGASPYELTVAWPVPASALTRAEFAGGTGVADGGPCDRMSVDLGRQNPAFFAGVFGRGGEQVRARAVVRVDASTGALGVPALLFLEREDCSTLDVSSGGQNNAGVHVLASSTSPGYIHTDSQAQGGGCSNNANQANGNSIWGTALPSAGGPSIRVDGVGGPGRIGLYSLSPGVDGRGAKEYQAGCTWVNAQNNSGCANSGLSVAGTGADIVSRLPVDTKYGARIATLYGTARSAAYGTGTNTNAWTVLSGNACTNLDGTYPASGTGNYYLNCDAAVANNATAVFNGSVVVRGALSVAGSLTVNGTSVTVGGTASVSGTWAMPNVRSVAVRGCAPNAPSSCSSLEVRPNATFVVNGSAGTTTCDVDRPPGNPAVNYASITVFGGPFTVNGNNTRVKMCQTTVALFYGGGGGAQATPPSAYIPVQVTSGSPNCATIRPCPITSTAQLPAGMGGNPPLLALTNVGSLNWTSPNQGSAAPSDASPFEDLALWVEGMNTGQNDRCTLSGQSALSLAGVFFHPNCDFHYTGQATSSNEANAQFVGRTMNVSGQVVLRLRPNPEDSIVVPLAGIPTLIR